MSDFVFGAERLQSAHFEMMRKSSFSKLSQGGFNRQAPPCEADNKVWSYMSKHLSSDVRTIQRQLINHAEYTLARNRFNLDEEAIYRATAYSIRDRLLELMNDSNYFFQTKDVKRCYYLSMEFLVGRAMQNALVNLDIEEQYKKALADLGYNLEALYEYEHDAALGNGGLGRLAACFLDAMATRNYACWGYGIRYTYGIFEQKLLNGWQCEYPDYWLVQDNPWEIIRHDVTYAVRFGGDVKTYTDSEGRLRHKWVGGQIVQAVAYDNPIPGFDTFNCINLRLWRAAPSKEFDFESFNAGRYMEAVKDRQVAEAISSVLYPNDNMPEGKELRLKQQYFFVCATIQDTLRRFRKNKAHSWADLPSKMCIQLNDTHPTIGIPELIRVLVDVEGLEWDNAVDITRRVFNYTNHTVLPEALEKWSAELMGRLLPRHVQIINELNFRFLEDARRVFGGDNFNKISSMSIYEEGYEKKIRMANLAVIGSSSVNGVAALHSELVKRDLFPVFAEYYNRKGNANKFVNMTNGVTTRRWIHNSNRQLSNFLSTWLGSDAWLKDLDQLKGMVSLLELGKTAEENGPQSDSYKFMKEWAEVKLRNKERLAEWIKTHGGPVVGDVSKTLFDVQVKRIHEYKRQHLNVFYWIHRYLSLKAMSCEERKKVVPRLSMIGGKAAPGYATAKTIIKLANCVADLCNADAETSPYFKCFFLPNYNVSSASVIIPGSDINQQISTAGMEASGTSNMKFVMNGSVIVGTMDGANVEIVEEHGENVAFIFGALEKEVTRVRQQAAEGRYPIDPRLMKVYDFVRGGRLTNSTTAQRQFDELVDRLTNNGNGHNGDFYLVAHDFPSYCRAQEGVDRAYATAGCFANSDWWRRSIVGALSMGKFSADRTVTEYANHIWHIEPAPVTPPAADCIKRLHTLMNIDENQLPDTTDSRAEPTPTTLPATAAGKCPASAVEQAATTPNTPSLLESNPVH